MSTRGKSSHLPETDARRPAKPKDIVSNHVFRRMRVDTLHLILVSKKEKYKEDCSDFLDKSIS